MCIPIKIIIPRKTNIKERSNSEDDSESRVLVFGVSHCTKVVLLCCYWEFQADNSLVPPPKGKVVVVLGFPKEIG